MVCELTVGSITPSSSFEGACIACTGTLLVCMRAPLAHAKPELWKCVVSMSVTTPCVIFVKPYFVSDPTKMLQNYFTLPEAINHSLVSPASGKFASIAGLL